jgi:chaperone modulatory protein CbpM
MSREQFLATSGLEVYKLEFWLEQEWLIPRAADSGFTDREVARARLIQDLESEFGVNNEGIDIILHLVDQLHGMRGAFARLQRDFAEPPGTLRPASPSEQADD